MATFVAIVVMLFVFQQRSDAQITTTTPATGEDVNIMRRIPGNCTSDQFDCGNRCIPIKRFRDCHEDCDDGSDEVCNSGFVRCLSSSGCACFKTSDAARFCPSKNDNKICSLASTQIFRCKNGNCVLNSWVNDQKNDCGDWSDEQLTALQPLH